MNECSELFFLKFHICFFILLLSVPFIKSESKNIKENTVCIEFLIETMQGNIDVKNNTIEQSVSLEISPEAKSPGLRKKQERNNS